MALTPWLAYHMLVRGKSPSSSCMVGFMTGRTISEIRRFHLWWWSWDCHHHPLARSASWLEEPSQKYVDPTIGINECGLSVVSWQLVESHSQGIAWWLEVAPLAVVMGWSPSSWYVCPMPGWTNPDLDPTSVCMTFPLPEPSRSSMSKTRWD